ncbi:FAD-dependent oxidoreductase, partial [Burkholderia pseudomallei]|nr:FAD-dependent oxidoreductase [Burkholderia pseudomallei]
GERPVPDGFARFGLARTFGLAGLAAAQLTYSAYEARDALAARRCARAGQPFRQRL